ncbi:MAG: CCA tRNA nucleotidyltransferase, partial [Sulfurimonas sp.]
MNRFNYPSILDTIFTTLNKKGIKPLIIGGYVRDYFLDIASKDIDIELYNSSSLTQLIKILEQFGSVNCVGKSFAVLKLHYKGYDLDFSLPRKDNKVAKGHKGFVITVDNALSFEEASKRRDFTINAMGYDVIEKKLLDPHKGLEDLQKKCLRAVDLQSFSQDPLRLLRAVGFASRFEFHIEKKLFLLMQSMVKEERLKELPKERVFEEIKKIFLKSKKPSIAFYLLNKLS